MVEQDSASLKKRSSLFAAQQLMQQKAQKPPSSAGEQKAMELLKTDPQMRHEFVSIVADQVVDKLIQCGLIL